MDSIGIRSGSDNREVIGGLIEGQDSAKRLLILLQKPPGDGWSELAGELLAKVLGSFEQGICQLGRSSGQAGESVLDSPAGPHQVSAFSSNSGVEGSDDSSVTRKRPAPKGMRGCYKRRNSTETLITVTPTMEDGQAWRKYGQKIILNAKFPRSYFRCTHKYDRDCKATKQVQMLEDGSGMYQTTYSGIHTCNRNPVEPPQLIIPDYPEREVKDFIVVSEPIKEETRDLVDMKSDLSTDNASFCSFQDYTSFPRFEFTSHHREDGQDDVSRLYRLGTEEDDGAHSEMELLARGPMGFHCDFYLDESEFS